jgi:hypothetical protein
MRRVTRASRAFLATLLVASSLLAGGASATLAQAETGVGVEVPYVDVDGVARGTVNVKQVGDPFTDFDPNSPPEAGSKYVGLMVAFTAADDQQMEANPYAVTLHDTGGNLWSPGFVTRPADATIPDLQSQTMAPGNRISGFIGYVLPETAVVDEVLYQPDVSRAILLADLVPGAGPAAGTPVAYTSPEGATADVSVTLTDPATEFDPSSPPEAGMRYVNLMAAFENTGDRRFIADPYQLVLQDANGVLIYPSYVPRAYDAPIPDLEAHTMAPGDRISGFVGYNVPERATIASVDYVPTYNQRIVVADLLGGGAVTPTESAEPAASEVPAASPAG